MILKDSDCQIRTQQLHVHPPSLPRFHQRSDVSITRVTDVILSPQSLIVEGIDNSCVTCQKLTLNLLRRDRTICLSADNDDDEDIFKFTRSRCSVGNQTLQSRDLLELIFALISKWDVFDVIE